MTVSNDALNKLRQGARRRRLLRQYKAAPRATYVATVKPANEATNTRIRMVVGDWYSDGLGNQARIIKACD
jgi:hypothetical protein